MGIRLGRACSCREERYLSPQVAYAGIKIPEFSFRDNASHTQICERYFFREAFCLWPEKMRWQGWDSSGLRIERADEEDKETALPLKDSPFSQRLLMRRVHTRDDDGKKDKITEMMIKELGGGWPSEVGIFPIIAEEELPRCFIATIRRQASLLPEQRGLGCL